MAELPLSQPERHPLPTQANHLSQPSIFWKAFANTIVPLLSNASNLTDENQALFLTTLTQTGIPGGALVPHEVTNYQVFIKADAVQQLNHPKFSLDGESYFDLLSQYLCHWVSAGDDPKIDTVRESLIKATKGKNTAWEGATRRYSTSIKDGPTTPSFQKLINGDSDYNTTLTRELNIKKHYASLQAGDMEDISHQLDTIRSADDKLSHKTGNNMPCSAMNVDFVARAVSNNNKAITVDPTTIFYRPLYSLQNWEMIANRWVFNQKPQIYEIDFSELDDVTWESFGHKELDQGTAPKLKPCQIDAIKRLRGKLTFFGEPAVMDIERGFWDVKHFRHVGQLSELAPNVIKHKFCKTTKFLLSWGFEIELTLPETAESISANSVDHINLSFLRVPMASVSDDGKVLKFSAPRMNYPWLIAALAVVI